MPPASPSTWWPGAGVPPPRDPPPPPGRGAYQERPQHTPQVFVEPFRGLKDSVPVSRDTNCTVMWVCTLGWWCQNLPRQTQEGARVAQALREDACLWSMRACKRRSRPRVNGGQGLASPRRGPGDRCSCTWDPEVRPTLLSLPSAGNPAGTPLI